MPIATVLRAPERRAQRTVRIEALDALRGLAVALMVLVNNPGDRDAMPAQLVHSTWHGFRVAEVVFPLFLFAVGVSMALSRRAGAARPMLRRVGLLVLIGCVLVSVKYRHPAPSTGTLQLIAGASLLAWAARRWLSRRVQVAAVVAVLGGLWAGFTLTGWARETNLAARVDAAVIGAPSDLGLLGMVSAATIVLAATWVGDAVTAARTPLARAHLALRTGAVALGAGLVLAMAVPVNKRIWTPSYDVVGFGVACLVFAVLLWTYGRFDRGGAAGGRVLGVSTLLRPFATLGTNAIAAYVATSLAATTVLVPVQDRVVDAMAAGAGRSAAAVGWAVGVGLLGYALCVALERRRIVIRL